MDKPKLPRTPSPWTAEPGGGRGAWIKGATGEWSALACGDTDESASANAQFIVQACNSYEMLVEAAGILASLEDPEWLGGGRRTPTKEECAAARAALSQARGEG